VPLALGTLELAVKCSTNLFLNGGLGGVEDWPSGDGVSTWEMLDMGATPFSQKMA